MDSYSVRLFCQFLFFPYVAALLCGFYFAFREIKKGHAEHNHFIPMKALSLKTFILMNIGGLVYVIIELLYRGYSHWTMYLVGGLCFIQLGLINEVMPWTTAIETQAILGTLIATANEFVSGLIINIGLGYNVWDYSNQPFNVFGQICLQFTFYWIFIAIFAIISNIGGKRHDRSIGVVFLIGFLNSLYQNEQIPMVAIVINVKIERDALIRITFYYPPRFIL